MPADAAETTVRVDVLGPLRLTVGDDAFFRTLKELVLVGYYTSEEGATQELRMHPMGSWSADVPYSDIGRAWA